MVSLSNHSVLRGGKEEGGGMKIIGGCPPFFMRVYGKIDRYSLRKCVIMLNYRFIQKV